MKATRKLVKIGGNYYFTLTTEMREFLEIDEDNLVMEWEDDTGKHGKFISIWLKNCSDNKSFSEVSEDEVNK